MGEGYKYITRFYFILLAFAALGSIVGALFYVNNYAQGDYIKNYLEHYAGMISGGVDGGSVALRSIKNSMLIVGIFAMCSFVRPGIIAVAAVVIRQGFVSGFANAVFIGTYGNKGLALSAVRLPESTIYFAAVLISGAAACTAAFFKHEKKSVKNFLIFLMFAASIFCASALAEGFLTTTFMKMILQ